MMDTSYNCILCLSSETELYYTEKNGLAQGDFFFCHHCHGIFKDPKTHLTSQDEKNRYDEHNNSLEDTRYLDYIKKSWDAFTEQISPNTLSAKPLTVLDYGCGPVKALEHILDPKVFNVKSWDKYYYPQDTLPKTFDIIFCHEVVEHFTNPEQEFKKLMLLTHPQSLIFVRTELHPNDKGLFQKWYYKNDPTHVFFFQKESFKQLALAHNLLVQAHIDKNKCILQRQS